MKAFILTCAFVCFTNIGFAARASGNFESIIIDGVEYFYATTPTRVSKTAAEAECIAQSACLAELENPTRQFLNTLARGLPDNSKFWIAGEIEPSSDPVSLSCGGGSIDWANLDPNLIDISSTSCLIIDRVSDAHTSKISALPCSGSFARVLCSSKLNGGGGGGGDGDHSNPPGTLRSIAIDFE